MPTDERVLVIPTERFHAAGYFQGYREATAPYREAILDPAWYEFRPRSEVETDTSFKQLIPYVVLKYGNRVYHYCRGASGTEQRLLALRSVGIGGHISEDDAAGGDDPYLTGMRREVREEVSIETSWEEVFLGFINDDRTPVGSVHLGVVHVFELHSPDATSREDALADGGFAPLAELAGRADEFETWSQFVLAELARNA